MSKPAKAILLVLLGIAVGAVLAVKVRSGSPKLRPTLAPAAASVPKLLAFGGGKCGPCRSMVPVLEQLSRDYAGVLAVQYIDVDEDSAAAHRHGVQVIPTELFLDAAGREIGRHEGFLNQEQILARFRQAGIVLSTARGVR